VNENDEAQRAEMNRVMPLAASHAKRSTIPLFAAHADGRRGVAGSGVLVRIAGEHFILTAAHVAVGFSGYGNSWCLATPSENDDAEPIALPKWNGYRSQPWRDQSHDDDPIDVAWIELPAEHAARLGKGFRFLDRTDLAEGATLDDRSIVYVHGFPSALVKSTSDTVEVQTYHYAAQVQSYAPEDTKSFDPRTQFLIAADREKRNGVDGSVTHLPDLEGISGCGVWLLGRGAPDGRLTLSGEPPSLVGIEHTYRRNTYIRCTKIGAAVEVLARANDRLRRALRIKI
jgi:hypothetical protein